jgi:hypothetical protein
MKQGNRMAKGLIEMIELLLCDIDFNTQEF